MHWSALIVGLDVGLALIGNVGLMVGQEIGEFVGLGVGLITFVQPVIPSVVVPLHPVAQTEHAEGPAPGVAGPRVEYPSSHAMLMAASI